MNLIRTNIALGSASLMLLFAIVACSHAPAPSTGSEAGTSGPGLEDTDLEEQILQPRPRSEYWWNFASEEIPLIQGGRFQDRRDSLGFDEYRALVEEEQRDRRRDAREYIKQGEKLGRARAALDQYASAVGLCPYLTEAWLYYAEGVINLGNYNSGRYLLHGVERTLRFAGNEGDMMRTASELYFLDAVASYNLGESDRALDSVSNSLLLKSNRDDARLLRARCFIDLERFEEARDELRWFEFGTPNYAHAQAVLGVLEMEAGEYGKSERAFNEAYEYGLRSGVMENDRGRLQLLLDEPEAAARHFERAVELQSDLMEARNNLAVALRRSGKETQAEEVLLVALQRNPDYAPAHFNLAELYLDRLDRLSGEELNQTGRAAINHYGVALDRGYRIQTVLEHRAYVHLVLNDPASAEEDLLKLSGTADTDGRVLFLLGRSKKDQGDHRIAEQLYRMALSREYREAEVYSDLGEVRLLRGDPEDARLHLEQALARDPSLVVTRINLSEALFQLGEQSEAERILEEAEALSPGDPAIAAQRQALRDR